MSKRWSYQVIEIKPNVWGSLKRDQLQDELTRQGLQGWELVSAFQSALAGPAMLILKKEQ